MRALRRRDRSGEMPLIHHLRELRRRLTIAAVAWLIATAVTWQFYEPIFRFLKRPLVTALVHSHRHDVVLAMAGVAEPFTLQLQVVAIAAVIAVSPIWLFHLWGFISPGLHRRERLWTWVFVSVSVPLFLSGVVLAYMLLPQALRLLFGFTPVGVSNIIPVATYITFVTRMFLVFGLAFLLPVVVVIIHSAGLISAVTLRSWWRQILVGALLFAAVATPTSDPINMLLLAVPMMVITFAAIGVCSLRERRKRPSEAEVLSDDEASHLS